MYQKKFKLFCAVLLTLCTMACSNKELVLKEIKHLESYPSGSAIAWLDDKLYLAGDDMPYILVMDKSFRVIDSIPIIAGKNTRIAKETKPDFEAMATIRYEKKTALLLLGSGSKDPYRNKALIFRKGESTLAFDLDSFYRKVTKEGIPNLNIEGAAAIPGGILLSSRGNKRFPKNYLLYTGPTFFQPKDSSDFKLIKVGTNTDTAFFSGISGLEYASKSDKLLLTVSTENTYDSYNDGSIGKSYLWIIDDITNRKRFSNLNPDKILDLEELDSRFKGHKIESVCIVRESKKNMELIFAADNDQGETWLFRVELNEQF